MFIRENGLNLFAPENFSIKEGIKNIPGATAGALWNGTVVLLKSPYTVPKAILSKMGETYRKNDPIYNAYKKRQAQNQAKLKWIGISKKDWEKREKKAKYANDNKIASFFVRRWLK